MPDVFVFFINSRMVGPSICSKKNRKYPLGQMGPQKFKNVKKIPCHQLICLI